MSDQQLKEKNRTPTVTNGARVEQVDEPLTTFIFELEAYPEAKSLSSKEITAIYQKLDSFYKVADLIGASEAYARLNAKSKRKKTTKTKGDK